MLLAPSVIDSIRESLYSSGILPDQLSMLVSGIDHKLLGQVPSGDSPDAQVRNYLRYFNRPFARNVQHPLDKLLCNAVSATELLLENEHLKDIREQLRKILGK